MEAILILICAILCDNLLLTKLFGVESFFTATEKPSGAALYGGLVTGVTVISGSAVFGLSKLYAFMLNTKDVKLFTTFTSVIVISAIICAFQLVSSKISKRAHSAVEATIPLISSNCIVLGAVLTCIRNGLSFGMSLVYLLAAGIGFTFVMLVFSGVQKRLESSNVAECFRGIPILLISCALAAMAFSGFFGLSF